MALLDDLRREKAQYESLAEVVSKISSKLSMSISALEPAVSGMSSAYTLNGYDADNGKIKSCTTKLTTMSDTLNSGVIPTINAKISELDGRIKAEEERIRREQEEAARRASEEAERAAREQEEQWNG